MAGARHYTQLRVWKLADELRGEVFALTARPKFARDFKAQQQVDDAINSVCRNIAEGFGCGTHAEVANFLVYSRRSLNEVRDAIRAARMKEYVNAEDLQRISDLVHRLHPALSRFIGYLRRTPDPNRNNRKPECTDTRQRDRTDRGTQVRTNQRRNDRTDKHQYDRTDERQQDRTDHGTQVRTDQRRHDRTDKRQHDRTDSDRDRTDRIHDRTD
jgi:four helix bundle protein